MPGASAQTRRVRNLNANWSPDDDGGDGHFEIMLVTEDDRQATFPASPAALAAIVALAGADTVLAWDPTGPTLIAANIVGKMPWTTRPRDR
jgi:hypothetical protein